MADRGLTIQRMVRLAQVSRAGYYRFEESASRSGSDSDMELRDAIQRIALEWPSYGRRRITEELRRRSWTINPKRVHRLMREDILLCVRKRKFVVTTDSNHGKRIYPNLARKMVLTDVDQLWVADITYIRLRDEFVFLAVILDAYSRRVIGWALDRIIEDDLTLRALRMALAQRVIDLVWFTTLIEAHNMPAVTTRICSRKMASKSACHAREILGTMPPVSRS